MRPHPGHSTLGGRQMVKKAVAQRRKAAVAPTKKESILLTGSSAPKEAAATLESEIGAEVRRLRKSFDLTVSELGVASGISTGMLSKIENGSISPSLSTLSALAKALNVPIAGLFRETGEQRDCSFVKAGTGVRIERRGTKAGHMYDLLGHSLGGEVTVEPYLITLKADAEPYIDFRHAGVEFIYMLTGKVRYRHADRTFSGARQFPVLRRGRTPWPRRTDQGTHDISVHHHLSATKLNAWRPVARRVVLHAVLRPRASHGLSSVTSLSHCVKCAA